MIRCCITVHSYSRSAWNQCLRHFQMLKATSWADPYFVVLNGFHHMSRSWSRLGLATSRSRSRLESRTSRLGLVSDKMPNVSVSSRSRTHASRVSSRSRPEGSRAHPCLESWLRLMEMNSVIHATFVLLRTVFVSQPHIWRASRHLS